MYGNFHVSRSLNLFTDYFLNAKFVLININQCSNQLSETGAP